MQKEYQVTLHSQLGPRDGRLSITSSGGSIAGVLTLLGFENPVTGRENGGGGFTLFHPHRTTVGNYPCESVFTSVGTELSGTAYLKQCSMHWSGKRLPQDSMEEHRG